MTHSKRMPWNTGSRGIYRACVGYFPQILISSDFATFYKQFQWQKLFTKDIWFCNIVFYTFSFKNGVFKISLILHWTVAIKQFKVIKHLQESFYRTLKPCKGKQSGLQVLNEITRQEIQILNTNYLSLHCFIAFVEMKSGFCLRKKVVSCGLSITEFFCTLFALRKLWVKLSEWLTR